MHTDNNASADGKVLNGIARGEALRSVRGETALDLMFFEGEQVVLLERLERGYCMGFCEGVVGRFQEQDVDFGVPSRNNLQISIPTSTATIASTTSPSSSLPPSLSPEQSSAISFSSAADEPALSSMISQSLVVSSSSPSPSSSSHAPSPRPVQTMINQGEFRSPAPSSAADEATIFGAALKGNLSTSQEDESVFPAPGHITPISSQVLDPLKAGEQTAPELKERLKPRKLLSVENLKLVTAAAIASNIPRRLILSSPPTPSSSEHFSLPSPTPPSLLSVGSADSTSMATHFTTTTTTTIYTANTSTINTTPQQPLNPSLSYAKGIDKHHHPQGFLSPPTQSTASSNADLNNCSSASITTNLLGIKSQVFNQQEHQQPRLVPPPINPVYQLSTPSSSNNSLTSSTPVSPVNSLTSVSLSVTQTVSSMRKEGAGTNSVEASRTNSSRPPTPTTEETPSQHRATQLKKKNQKKAPARLKTSSKDPASSSSSSLASPSLLDMQHEIGRDYALSGRPQQRHEHHQQDHYFATVFGDLRSKTNNVLRKAGFSIAPDAGLFADRESKRPMDLNVVRMPPTSATGGSTHAGNATAATSAPLQQRSGSHSAGGKEKESNKGTGFFGRPRSRSVKENRPVVLDARPPPLPSTKSSTESSSAPVSSSSSSSSAFVNSQLPPTPTSSSSSFSVRFDRLRQWSISDRGHHRSNSGPARHTDVGMTQKLTGLEESRVMDQYVHGNGDNRTQVVPLPPLPPLPPQVVIGGGGNGPGGGGQSSGSVNGSGNGSGNGGIIAELRRKKKGHQRRMSEATTVTTTSTRSAGGYPQRFQIQQQHQPSGLQHANPLPPPEKQGRTMVMGNWFGKSKRRSYHSIEDVDPRKPHVLGHGIEGGVDSRPTSMLFLDCDEDDEDLFDDSEAEEEEQENRRHSRRGTADGQTLSWSSTAEVAEKKPQVLVNDYGFICDVEEENSKTQEQSGSGTGSIVGDMAAKLDSTFLAEHERKRLIKKQHEFTRVSENKWIHAITQLQPEQIKKSNKYKKLVRRGVPTSVRGRVWQFLANTQQYREPGLFQELLSRGHIPIYDIIARDVHRCYPDHVHFRDGMGGTGQEDLHSILKAYAHYKPSVGYCQGMGRLVGMMLMQMPVEEAFWLLVATIENYLNEYFTPTLRQLRIDAQVFERLFKAEDPRLAAHLERNDVLPIMYMTQWFLTLFTMSLPWASVLRVWDVFYFDGVKTLFRVGLAVLQICRGHLLEHCPSSSECMDYLLHVPLEILGPEVLLERTAFRIRLKRDNIEKMSILTAGEMDAKEGGSGVGGTETSKSSSVSAATKVEPSSPISVKEIKSLEPSPQALPTIPSDTDDVDTAAETATATTAATIVPASTLDTLEAEHDDNRDYTQEDEPKIQESVQDIPKHDEDVKVDSKERDDGKDREKSSPSSPYSPNSPTVPEKELPALPIKPRSQPAGLRPLTMSTSSPSLAEVASLACVPVPTSPISPLPSLPPNGTAPTSGGVASGFLFKMRKRAGTMRG
ncbi:hypothetical protein BGX28_001694 [Mortierella sp. GBA30]|nr:hypothetical protein BGX28_001694 [Mortierella sp. GBA30]